MNADRSENRPRWTDETLSLPVPRRLLAEELKRLHTVASEPKAAGKSTTEHRPSQGTQPA